MDFLEHFRAIFALAFVQPVFQPLVRVQRGRLVNAGFKQQLARRALHQQRANQVVDGIALPLRAARHGLRLRPNRLDLARQRHAA